MSGRKYAVKCFELDWVLIDVAEPGKHIKSLVSLSAY